MRKKRRRLNRRLKRKNNRQRKNNSRFKPTIPITLVKNNPSTPLGRVAPLMRLTRDTRLKSTILLITSVSIAVWSFLTGSKTTQSRRIQKNTTMVMVSLVITRGGRCRIMRMKGKLKQNVLSALTTYFGVSITNHHQTYIKNSRVV